MFFGKTIGVFFFLVTFRTIKSVFLTLKVANKSCQQRKFSESTLKERKEKLGSAREAVGERGSASAELETSEIVFRRLCDCGSF